MNTNLLVKNPEIYKAILDLPSKLYDIGFLGSELFIKDELNFNGYVAYLSDTKNSNNFLLFLTQYNVYEVPHGGLVMEGDPLKDVEIAHAYSCVSVIKQLSKERSIPALAISNCLHPKLVETCFYWFLTKRSDAHTFINMKDIPE